MQIQALRPEVSLALADIARRRVQETSGAESLAQETVTNRFACPTLAAAMFRAGAELYNDLGGKADLGRNPWTGGDAKMMELIAARWNIPAIDGLQRFAKTNADDLNAAVESAIGISPGLSNIGPGIYMSGCFMKCGEFRTEGNETQLHVGDRTVEGFWHAAGRDVILKEVDGIPVAFIEDADGGYAILVKSAVRGLAREQLLAKVAKTDLLFHHRRGSRLGTDDKEMDGTIIPNVDLTVKEDLMPYFIGTRLADYMVKQAKGVVVLKMNNVGFVVKAAVSAGATRGMGPRPPQNPLRFDQEFIWAYRPAGTTIAVAAVNVTPEDFKTPADLD